MVMVCFLVTFELEIPRLESSKIRPFGAVLMIFTFANYPVFLSPAAIPLIVAARA